MGGNKGGRNRRENASEGGESKFSTDGWWYSRGVCHWGDSRDELFSGGGVKGSSADSCSFEGGFLRVGHRARFRDMASRILPQYCAYIQRSIGVFYTRRCASYFQGHVNKNIFG